MSVETGNLPGDEIDKRAVTIRDLLNLRENSLKAIDQLTVASGYSQIALLKAAECGCDLELEKVVDRITRAARSVQSCRMTVEKLIHEEVD